MNLEELLKRYKDITIEMISKIDDNADISILIEKRQLVLSSLLSIDITKEKFGEIYKKLEIEEYEEKLQSLTQSKMLDVKKEIKKLRQSQVAYKKYSDFNGNAMIFSTKI